MDLTDRIENLNSDYNRFFGKRNSQNFPKLKCPTRIIFFGGGYSKGIKNELIEINGGIRLQNVWDNVLYKKDGGTVFLPIFEGLDTMSGILTENANSLVRASDAYFQIIGDGFGDTSKSLAEATYEIAQELKMPTHILVKKERKANHPQYAEDFLKKIKNKRLIIEYNNAEEAARKTLNCLEKMFKSSHNK